MIGRHVSQFDDPVSMLQLFVWGHVDSQLVQRRVVLLSTLAFDLLLGFSILTAVVVRDVDICNSLKNFFEFPNSIGANSVRL